MPGMILIPPAHFSKTSNSNDSKMSLAYLPVSWLTLSMKADDPWGLLLLCLEFLTPQLT